MADPRQILATIERATALFRQTPSRVGAEVRLDESVRDVIVLGDLHGHLHVLASLLKIANLDEHPRRHLVLQEPTHDSRIDPDEGEIDRSHRTIDLICALKCKYPGRLHLILGNHELSEFTGRSISKKGFALNKLFRQGVEGTYGEHAEAFVTAYHDLFRALPLAVRTPNRVFLCHTVPSAADLETIDLGVLHQEGDWPPESLKRGGSVYALTWGRDTDPETSERFATLVDADLLICGHHPCDEGFQNPNPRLLILDGTDPYPTYCHFPANEPLDMLALLNGVRTVPMPDR